MSKKLLLSLISIIFLSSIPLIIGKVADAQDMDSPEISKIITHYDTMDIILPDCGYLCRDLVVSYAKDPVSVGAEIRFSPQKDNETGYYKYQIGALDTNSTYYVKIKCFGEDPKCSQYSKPEIVKTTKCQLQYRAGNLEPDKVDCNVNTEISASSSAETLISENQKNWNDMNLYVVVGFVVMVVALGVYYFKFRIVKHEFKKRPRTLYRTRAKKK
ncbi:MAG: hypothetical protein U0525_03710 [Patescibacteria group bacterium]